jgi:NADP-dependent 3-hydroxy acid dehydrogenase YdfG
MREQADGLIINVSSWAGKYVSRVSGGAYSAAKHALNAMTESINQENCQFGIRACAICPGEVATEILDKRPVPVSQEDRAKMVQAEDLGDLIVHVCRTPAHVCLNEITISPTWNRGYIGR